MTLLHPATRHPPRTASFGLGAVDEASFAERDPASTRAANHFAWLVRLRWTALAAVLMAVLAAPLFDLRGLNRPVLFAVIGVGALYNAAFQLALRRRRPLVDSALLQALVDFGALTLALWASGGVRNPFVSLYLVHVLFVSTLAGKRAALLACGAALASASFLVLVELWPALRISSFESGPRAQLLLDALAFVVLLVASGYVLDRASAQLAGQTKDADEARRALRRDEEILLAAMDRLEVGVEILSPEGSPRFRNRHLLLRHGRSTDCPRDSRTCEPFGGVCPVDAAAGGRSGVCRFSQRDPSGRERVIELLSYPLGDGPASPVLRLHLDRTESVIAERRLLFAERLASLGRTAQVVAHELNTPLATIQTLAADMRVALKGAPREAAALAADLDESAGIIHDETRRCRGITQDLLAGRDLLAGTSTSGPCELAAALQRAALIVFGTGGAASRLVVARELARRSVAIGHDSMVQIFVSLLQNAADAIQGVGGARVRVGLDAPPAQQGQLAVLIDDDGPGLAAGTRDRIFEPFFTTKPEGKGTGLGLYTAAALLAEVGGTVTLGDAPDGGARVRLVLPVAS